MFNRLLLIYYVVNVSVLSEQFDINNFLYSTFVSIQYYFISPFCEKKFFLNLIPVTMFNKDVEWRKWILFSMFDVQFSLFNKDVA